MTGQWIRPAGIAVQVYDEGEAHGVQKHLYATMIALASPI